MYISLLFVIGAAIGACANLVAWARTHHARFNNIFAGILGALLGGLVLPRAIGGMAASPEAFDARALLIAAATAAGLVAILVAVRHRIAQRT